MPSIDYTCVETMAPQLKNTRAVTDDADQLLLFSTRGNIEWARFCDGGQLPRTPCISNHAESIQQSEGTSDRRMFRWLLRLNQASYAGCVFFKSVQMPLWGGRGRRWWGRIRAVFLEILQFVLANRCCRLSQQRRKSSCSTVTVFTAHQTPFK